MLIASAAFGRAVLAPGAVAVGTGNPGSPQLTPGNPIRIDLRTPVIASSEGYLVTVQKTALIEIFRRNVERLEGVVRLFRAYETGGRLTSLQVSLLEVQKLNAQSQLLTAQRDARDSLDRIKLQLGLPLDTPLELDLRLGQIIVRQYNRYEALLTESNALMDRVDTMDDMSLAGQVRGDLVKILTESPLAKGTQVFKAQFPARWAAWKRDVLDDKALFEKASAMRKERQRLLDDKEALEAKEQELPRQEADKLQRIEQDLPLGDLEYFLRRFEAMPWKALATDRARREEFAARFRDVRNAFSDVLAEASNERIVMLRPYWPKLPPVTIDGIDIVEGELEPALEAAKNLALDQRLDLMNARAQRRGRLGDRGKCKCLARGVQRRISYGQYDSPQPGETAGLRRLANPTPVSAQLPVAARARRRAERLPCEPDRVPAGPPGADGCGGPGGEPGPQRGPQPAVARPQLQHPAPGGGALLPAGGKCPGDVQAAAAAGRGQRRQLGRRPGDAAAERVREPARPAAEPAQHLDHLPDCPAAVCTLTSNRCRSTSAEYGSMSSLRRRPRRSPPPARSPLGPPRRSRRSPRRPPPLRRPRPPPRRTSRPCPGSCARPARVGVYFFALALFAAAAAGLAWKVLYAGRSAEPYTGPTWVAAREKLVLSIVERGTLESAENSEIICRVKASGRGTTVATTIKWLVDDGRRS